jgi:hypothetical protein
MKTSRIDEYRISLETKTGFQIGSFEKDVDGYYYYWPGDENRGSYSDCTLRKIADMLQELNKEWNETVEREIGH